MSGSAKTTVEEMLESLVPQKEKLQAIQDECLAAGKAVPESVTKGLSDIAMWEAMTGSQGVSGMYTLLAQSLAEDPAKLEALTQNKEFGKNIPKELADAIEMYTGLTVDSNTGMWAEVGDSSKLSAAEAASYLNQYGGELDESLANGIAQQYGLVKKNGSYMVDQAAQGVKSNKKTFMSASSNVALAGVNQMHTDVTGSTVGPPKIAEPDATGPVSSSVLNAQAWVNDHPISLVVQAAVNGASAVRDAAYNALRGAGFYGDGGIVEQPQLAWVAEAGYPEAIISFDPNKRARSEDLWWETGRRLGIESYAYSANAGYALGASRAAKAQAVPATQNLTNLRFEKGSVVVETNSAAPDDLVDTLMERFQFEVDRRNRGHGHLF